jgi:hypothetical protein
LLLYSQETKKRNTSTERPRNQDDLCPFFFNVYWDPDQNRWYVPQRCPGDPTHAGHAFKEAHCVVIPAKNVGVDSVKLAEDCLKQHTSTDAIKALMQLSRMDNRNEHEEVLGQVEFESEERSSNSNNEGSSDDDIDERELEMIAERLRHNNAYTLLLPLYSQAAERVSSARDFVRLRKNLERANEQLLPSDSERQSRRMQEQNGGGSTFVSLPSVDRARSSKRRRPKVV